MWSFFCSLSLLLKVTNSPFLGCQNYQAKRDFITELLESVGFDFAFKPKGSFFIFAQLPSSCTHSDVCTFCTVLKSWFYHLANVGWSRFTDVCWQHLYLKNALPYLIKIWQGVVFLTLYWQLEILAGRIRGEIDQTSRSGCCTRPWILSSSFRGIEDRG